MRLGAHVSAAGGLHLAPARAAELGLETFQFFSRSPQGGRAPALTPEQVSTFLEACDRHGFDTYYVHAPYVINLASVQERISSNSIDILKEELARCSDLAVAAMMTHLGSSTGGDHRQGLKKTAAGLRRILAGYEGSTRLLVEVSAGAGQILGSDFGEIREILDLVGDERLGVCLDTAHAFASGYDLRTTEAVAGTLAEFDGTIGMDKLAVTHINDSKVGLGARRDRHEHLGRGMIGLNGFKSLLARSLPKNTDLILETPSDAAGRRSDMEFLRQWRV